MISIHQVDFEITRRLNIFSKKSATYHRSYLDAAVNEALQIYFERMVDYAEESAKVASAISLWKTKEIRLDPVERTNLSYVFKLPENYYRNQGEYAYVSKGSCKNRYCELHREPGFKIPSLLKNSDWQPSFEWGETIWDQAADKMHVYHGNTMSIDAVLLDYYRWPLKLISTELYPKDEIPLDPATNTPLTVNIGLEVSSQESFRKVMDIFQLIIARDRNDQLDFQMEINKLLTLKNIFL